MVKRSKVFLITFLTWNTFIFIKGFATLAAYLPLETILPGWETWTGFVNERIIDAMELDSYVNTHPVQAEIKDPAEIGERFDSISYHKGASVLRMLKNYLGDKVFKKYN
jgi:aminopeptidase N